METKAYSTVVEMPNKKLLDVEYYCINEATTKQEKDSFTQLFIQLDDCICTMKIEKSIINKKGELERIVHNKVINERGHLC
jgi:hypothetical protein